MKNYFIISLFSFMASCALTDGLRGPDDEDASMPGKPDAGGDTDAGPIDADGDGFTAADGDCDDNDPEVNPGMEEVKYNGKDDDCDGQLDEVTVCPTGGDFSSIQEAINMAPVGGAVNVCAGIYSERLTITKPTVLNSLADATTTIVDADGGSNALLVNNTSGDVIVDGLTFLGSDSSGVHCHESGFYLLNSIVRDNTSAGAGGGIYLENCTGEIVSSLIKNNTATRGGGIFQQAGSVAIRNSEITGNTAFFPVKHYGIGGGVYLFSNADLTNNIISNNISSARGGGITVEDHSPLIDGNTITNNWAGDDGGGLFVITYNNVENQTIVINNNLFQGNHSEDDAGGIRLLGTEATVTNNRMLDNTAISDGGGMKASHSKSLISDNIISGNIAYWGGGGIELDDDHSTVLRCIITNNRAHHGGGINYLEVQVPFKLESTLIANNEATSWGGGVSFVEVETSYSELSFVTIVGNSAPDTGGAHFSSTVIEVNNSIIANNTGAQVKFEEITTWEDELLIGAPKDWKYNDVYPLDVEGMSYPSGNISANPGFVSSSNFQLAAGSVCIGTGENGADMGAYGGPNHL